MHCLHRHTAPSHNPHDLPGTARLISIYCQLTRRDVSEGQDTGMCWWRAMRIPGEGTAVKASGSRAASMIGAGATRASNGRWLNTISASWTLWEYRTFPDKEYHVCIFLVLSLYQPNLFERGVEGRRGSWREGDLEPMWWLDYVPPGGSCAVMRVTTKVSEVRKVGRWSISPAFHPPYLLGEASSHLARLTDAAMRAGGPLPCLSFNLYKTGSKRPWAVFLISLLASVYPRPTLPFFLLVVSENLGWR